VRHEHPELRRTLHTLQEDHAMIADLLTALQKAVTQAA